MSEFNNYATFRANAAASAGVRVVISPNGSISVAGNAASGIGVLERDVSAESWDSGCVKLFGGCTFLAVVTGVPVTAGDTAYAAALGAVAATGTVPVGTFCESVTTNGLKAQIAPIMTA